MIDSVLVVLTLTLLDVSTQTVVWGTAIVAIVLILLAASDDGGEG